MSTKLKQELGSYSSNEPRNAGRVEKFLGQCSRPALPAGRQARTIRKPASLINLFVVIFLILLLVFRFVSFRSDKPKFKDNQEITLTVVLTSQPQVYQKSQRFEVQGIKIIASAFPQYFYGDKLKIIGTLKNRALIFPQIEILERGRGSFVLTKVFSLRKRLISLFESFLPEPAASLFLGIFLGVKRTLAIDFYLALRKTGVLHVVVASGMNVTMVASFALTFLNLIFKRRGALVLTVLAILFYSALSGFDAPIVRAAIMGIVVILGEFFGRLNFRVLSLFLAGYLMIFLEPNLIFDLGFQLSFASTAGLIFIKPLLPIKEEGSFGLLKGDLATTISAQIAALPILLANFGQYQVLSLIVNTLVLWTTPILMAFGGVVAVAGLLFPLLGQIFAFLALPFLFYFEKIVIFFSQISFAEIGVGKPPFVFVLGYYLLLTSILLFCYKKT